MVVSMSRQSQGVVGVCAVERQYNIESAAILLRQYNIDSLQYWSCKYNPWYNLVMRCCDVSLMLVLSPTVL